MFKKPKQYPLGKGAQGHLDEQKLKEKCNTFFKKGMIKNWGHLRCKEVFKL